MKTPIPLLILAVTGLSFLLKDSQARPRWQSWTPVLSAAAMLIVGLMSHINTGVRHILPIYVMLAAIAGLATGILDCDAP